MAVSFEPAPRTKPDIMSGTGRGIGVIARLLNRVLLAVIQRPVTAPGNGPALTTLRFGMIPIGSGNAAAVSAARMK